MKSRGPGFAPHPGQPLFFKKKFEIRRELKELFFATTYFFFVALAAWSTQWPVTEETRVMDRIPPGYRVVGLKIFFMPW
jgi:hypothetical protein